MLDVNTTSTWVNARHILVETEQKANDIITALNAGESFVELARINSIDTGSAQRGGELDWQDLSGFVAEFGDAVRTLPIGEISAPVQTEFGFHIIQVRAREERDLDQAYIDHNRQQEFEKWVSNLLIQGDTDYTMNDIWLDYIPETPVFALRGNY